MDAENTVFNDQSFKMDLLTTKGPTLLIEYLPQYRLRTSTLPIVPLTTI